MNYRTEIHVADDGYVCLQLPDFVPRGRATVTVSFAEPEGRVEDPDPRQLHHEEDDRDDIEWWDDLDA